MTKNVCMVAYTDYTADARVRREAETLVATGLFSVTFFTLREGKNPRTYKLEGVDVVELDASKYRGQNKIMHFWSYLRFLLLSFLACSKFLFAGKLDAIHIHNMPNFLIIAAILPRLFGKRTILDIHDSTPETFFARYGNAANKMLFRLYFNLMCWEESFCCRLAHNVICVNHVQRDALVRRGIPAEKISISMNVPDPKWFEASKMIRRNGKGETTNLIYHGTIAKRLGIDLAIRAFAKARRADSDMRFYIIGDGEGIAECLELRDLLGLQQYVHFSGKMVPLESLLAILQDMDVGVVANRENTATELMLPVKLLEYVALNIPAIAPRTRAIGHYFADDMVSYFEPGDVDSLARTMLDLCRDATRSKAQAEKASSFLDKYGWEKHREDFIDLYKEIAECGKVTKQ